MPPSPPPTDHRWVLNAHGSKKALLRRLVVEDTPVLFARIQAEQGHLRRWLGWLDFVRTEEDVLRFVEQSQSVGPDGPIAYECGLFVDNELAGVAGLNAINFGQGLANLGYWLGQPFEGRGLMTQAAERLAEFGMFGLGLARIEIRAAVSNRPSQRVAERAGFVREGVLRSAQLLHGVRHDLIVYSRVRSAPRPASS